MICDQFPVSHRHGVRSSGLNIERSQKAGKECMLYVGKDIL
jgi:hypothetical protein